MLLGLQSNPNSKCQGCPTAQGVLQLETAQGGNPTTLWTAGVFLKKGRCRVMSAAPGIYSGEAWAQDGLSCAQWGGSREMIAFSQ